MWTWILGFLYWVYIGFKECVQIVAEIVVAFLILIVCCYMKPNEQGNARRDTYEGDERVSSHRMSYLGTFTAVGTSSQAIKTGRKTAALRRSGITAAAPSKSRSGLKDTVSTGRLERKLTNTAVNNDELGSKVSNNTEASVYRPSQITSTQNHTCMYPSEEINQSTTGPASPDITPTKSCSDGHVSKPNETNENKDVAVPVNILIHGTEEPNTITPHHHQDAEESTPASNCADASDEETWSTQDKRELQVNVKEESVLDEEDMLLYHEESDESNMRGHLSEFPACKIDLRGMRLDYAMFYLYRFLTYRYGEYIKSGGDENIKYVNIVTGFRGNNEGESSVIKYKVDKHLKRIGYRNGILWISRGEVRVDLSAKADVEEDIISESDDEDTRSTHTTTSHPPTTCKSVLISTVDLRHKSIEDAKAILEKFVKDFREGNTDRTGSAVDFYFNIMIDTADESTSNAMKEMIENYLQEYSILFRYTFVKPKYQKVKANLQYETMMRQKKRQPRAVGALPRKGENFCEPDDKKIDVRQMCFKEALKKVEQFICRMSPVYGQTQAEEDRYIYIVTGFGKYFGNNRIKRGIAYYFKKNDFGTRYIWIKAGLLMFDLKEEIRPGSGNKRKRRFVYFPDCEPEDKKLDIRGNKKEEAIDMFQSFLAKQLEIYKCTGNRIDRYVYVVPGFHASNPDIGPVLKPAVQDYLNANGFMSRHRWFNGGGLVMIDLEESDDLAEFEEEGDTFGLRRHQAIRRRLTKVPMTSEQKMLYKCENAFNYSFGEIQATCVD